MERTPRRFWTFAVSAGALLVILAAAVSGLFQFAVQAVPGYRAKVEADVRELTGRDIRIDQLGLTWRYYYPSLDLNGVALLGADGETPVLRAERLRLGFALTRLVRGDTTPSRLELHGLGLNATVGRDGQVTVQGIETAGLGTGGGEAIEALGPLARFSRVRLERCRVNLRDERRGDEVYSFGIAEATLDRGLLGDVLALDVALPASLGDNARFEVFFTGELLQPSTWSGTVRGDAAGLVARTWLNRYFVRGARLDAADTELRFSGALERGALQSARVELRSGPITARRAQHVAQLEAFEARGRVEAIAGGWRARIEQLSVEGTGGRWSSTGEVTATRTPGGRWQLDADAEYLRVDELAPWLQIVAVPPALASLNAMSGSVRQLQLHVQDDGDEWRYGYRARFDGLALPATAQPAGFSGLRGEVAGDERGGRAVLQESRVVLETPGRFATPTLPFEAFEAEVEWRRQQEGWMFGMPQFRWQLWGTRGRGRFTLTPSAGAPVLHLQAQFSSDDVTRAKPLMPTRWGAGLRSWLDRSIVAGRAPRANLVIQGPLADFPYHVRPTGRWSLDIDASDIELAYHPDWPGVSDLAARLHFEGNSLAIEATRGTVAGNALEKATARFPDFATGQLLIDGATRGETARYYDFLRRSPLRDTLKGLLSQTTARGTAAVDIHLDIPVKEPQRTRVDGRVALDGVTLDHGGLPEPIREIRGELAFDGAGAITAEKLTGRLYEVPLEASIAPQAARGSLLDARLRLAIDPAGKGASALIPAWLRARAAGASDWRATLALGGPGDAAVRLTSDLVGVELAYPPPLGKARDDARPLALTIGSAGDAPLHITVEAAGRIGADLRFRRRGAAMALARGVLRLGPGTTPVATEDGLVLTGELPEIDLQEWQRSLAASGLGAADQAIRRADVKFGLARWSPFALRDLRYQWNVTRSGWALVVSGAQASGEVRWASADHGLLTARLERLQAGYAPAETEGEADADAVPVDPNALPQFDLDIGKLVLGRADLGHVTFATSRTELGQKARALKASGGIVTLAGEGEWRRRAGQSSGSLSADLATTDIATLLRTFGYTPNLDSKAARFKAALSWPPSDRGLEWPRAEGTVHVEFDNGQLRAVEPGAGRVLGLMNFYALPRRLTLNFRDVVSKGLGFDRIRGDFELRDGDATTENLRVAGPSVRMDMRGRIGLAARDYDQQVTVYPDVSGGVTLGAVLFGGPVAGALALIAQEVMGKPLNQVTQLTYRVTGSWDNPQVTQGNAPPPADPAAPAAPPGKERR
jgi:uncharacterized protein (TIGR02099 family)